MAILADLETHMLSFDPHTASPARVRTLLSMLHRCRRTLGGFEDRLAEAAVRHEEEGTAAPAEETLTSGGDASPRAARDAKRRRSAAEEMDELGDSIQRGDARSENVEAIARALAKLKDPGHRATFISFDGRLTELAEQLSPADFRRQLERYVRRATADHGLSLAERQRAASRLAIWRDKEGMYVINGKLDPEWGGQVAKALDVEMRALARSRERTGETDAAGATSLDDHLRAEALVERLRRSDRATSGLALPLIGCLVDHETVHRGPHGSTRSEWWDGSHLPPETLQRLQCDALFQEVMIDGSGLPLAVGRRYRTATDAQRLALRAIYTGCVWSGCDRIFDHCQIHHVVPWEHGGQTDLDNLVPLCSHHHHLVHDGRWTLKLEPDRTIWIWRPDGEHHATASHPATPGKPTRGQASDRPSVPPDRLLE